MKHEDELRRKEMRSNGQDYVQSINKNIRHI